MQRIARQHGLLATMLILTATEESTATADPPALKRTLQLGILENQFEGVPHSFRDAAAQPFMKLMKKSTGLDGQTHYLADPMKLAEQIDNGQIDFAIFRGYEFAWAKAKYPDLVPLALAIQYQTVQVLCIAPWDSKAANLSDFANQKISISPICRELCELVLAKEQALQMKDLPLAQQIVSNSGFEAILEVIDGHSGCAFVDRNVLKSFEAIHPGKIKNLKIIFESTAFPDSCVAMSSKKIDAQTIAKLRQTLLSVETLPGGKALLALWKLKGFTKIPADYDKSLEMVQKEFPMLSK
ncbi:MAG: phosphate/phosphite/phosphonate ABC transporter substrate-binding protein [Planctomycetes bacterium]|nr:phosphate/phosphite/phosphonate ABC transporter substrate-binding protein [Planctomycetota bacterium]